MQQLDKKEAIKMCTGVDCFIKKVSQFSSGGEGVKLYDLTDMTFDERARVCESVLESPYDFVVQERIVQHDDMSMFNRSSVNTLRFTSLYLNGNATIQNIILRIGKRGSFVDNMASGGIVVGVNGDGHLNSIAYDSCLNMFEEYNGVVFKNVVMPQVPDIAEKILFMHKTCFPLCKFIGWDICIDRNGEYIVLEVNTSQPGISGEQINGGPIFGDRTSEVIDYCINKKFVYGRSILRY